KTLSLYKQYNTRPVSYTHLDVYKRQPQALVSSITQQPVSYTHLDVYKRQTVGFAAGVGFFDNATTVEQNIYKLANIATQNKQLSLIHI
ncbi:hypothetical protein A5865_003815, partial [Enterococcus sp. 12E11_DIV0728]